MKNVIGLSIFILLLLAAGAIFYWDRSSEPNRGEPVRSLTPLACTACGKAYGAMAGALPTECNYCKQPTAWRARKCLKCNAIFPCVQDPASDSPNPIFTCTKCQSTKSTEVGANDVEIINP